MNEIVPALDTDQLAAFRRELGAALVENALTLAPAREPAPAGRPGRRAARMRRAPALALAGVAAAVAAITLLSSGGTTVSGIGVADAALVLHAAAGAQLHAASDALRPGDYWLIRTENATRRYDPSLRIVYTDSFTASEWTGRDGAGRAVQSRSHASVETAAGQRRWRSAGSRYVGQPGRRQRLRPAARPFAFGFTTLSYRQLRSLPADPDRLRAELTTTAARQEPIAPLLPEWRRTPAAQAAIVFRLLVDAFAAPVAPGVRAALYELASRLPGIRYDGRIADQLGRPGVAVSTVLGAVRFRLIVSPVTGALLETDRFLIRHSNQLSQPELIGLYSRYTFLAARVVASDR